MKQICISTNVDMLNQDSKKDVKENIKMQLTNAYQMINVERDPHAAFAFIVDGKTLTCALEEDLKHQFLNLAVGCASVICCHVSPKQKALAVMASDFAVAQFWFLERLLVVHCHRCYKRIAQMICYFFYKNIAFGLTSFYFEAFTGFSGQSVYDDWYMHLVFLNKMCLLRSAYRESINQSNSGRLREVLL